MAKQKTVEKAVKESTEEMVGEQKATLLPGEFSMTPVADRPWFYDVFKGHVRIGWVYRHGCGRVVFQDDHFPMTKEALAYVQAACVRVEKEIEHFYAVGGLAWCMAA